jgi:hypothetical protein
LAFAIAVAERRARLLRRLSARSINGDYDRLKALLEQEPTAAGR